MGRCTPSELMQEPFIKTRVIVVMALAAVLGVACLIVAAFLAAPDDAFPTAPEDTPVAGAVKGLVTGLGVLAIAYPCFATGRAIKKRAAASPYFEAGFIAAVIDLFGLVCVGVGLASIGLGAYDVIRWLLDSP